MTTWLESAVSQLEKADKDIPPGTPLQERRKILTKLLSGYGNTSWGRKVRPRAIKQVLAKYYVSDEVIPPKHLSPLERMMRKAGR